MKKPFTKSDYKRKKREVKRTSQKLNSSNNKKKFNIGDIVKLKKGGDDMGYVEQYRYGKVLIKWISSTDYHLEDDLIKVA
jgi:uncharacterized protein YodC (DUF2158 family)